MTDPAGDAVSQQEGQAAVDRGVRLAKNARQLRRVDEGHLAEGVEWLSVGERHVLRVAKESPGGQSYLSTTDLVPPPVPAKLDLRLRFKVLL